MLLEDAALGRENAELIQENREASARMGEMVQNLLDANGIEHGEMKLNLALTDLGPVLASVIGTQRTYATAKQQTIHLESETTPVVVQVDPGVTVQVLENLVSNAVNYSPPGKNISCG